MCEYDTPAQTGVAEEVTPSRRRLLVGGAASALMMASAAPSALAATPPMPPGAKPDAFLVRLGLKPPAPDRSQTVQTGAFTPGGQPQGPTVTQASLRPAPTGGPLNRTLALDNINTGERLTVTYMENGRYVPDALRAINHLMRDRRSGDVATMDPALLDLICDIRARIGSSAPVKLISGYRAPKTNARLARTDGAVATGSYHTRGMAADIAIPGCSIGDLRRVAVAMGRGGVGAYPQSGFVHVDVGPPRTW